MKNKEDKLKKQLKKVFSEDFSGINHSEETGFTFEKITEDHLYNLGIGDGNINISVTLEGKESKVIKTPISLLREIQAYHNRSCVGEILMISVETLIKEINERQ